MRINIFGGPGVGKSTFAMLACAELRRKGIFVEYVDEWIKRWAYEKKEIGPWDQLHVFSNQLEKESFFLKRKIPIITDSPLLLQYVYAPLELKMSILPIINAFNLSHPYKNYFLSRNVPYDQRGRWENEAEAIARDHQIQEHIQPTEYIYDWQYAIQRIEDHLRYL